MFKNWKVYLINGQKASNIGCLYLDINPTNWDNGWKLGIGITKYIIHSLQSYQYTKVPARRSWKAQYLNRCILISYRSIPQFILKPDWI